MRRGIAGQRGGRLFEGFQTAQRKFELALQGAQRIALTLLAGFHALTDAAERLFDGGGGLALATLGVPDLDRQRLQALLDRGDAVRGVAFPRCACALAAFEATGQFGVGVGGAVGDGADRSQLFTQRIEALGLRRQTGGAVGDADPQKIEVGVGDECGRVAGAILQLLDSPRMVGDRDGMTRNAILKAGREALFSVCEAGVGGAQRIVQRPEAAVLLTGARVERLKRVVMGLEEVAVRQKRRRMGVGRVLLRLRHQRLGGPLFPALDQLDQRVLQVARGLGVARLQRAEAISHRPVFAVLTTRDLGERHFRLALGAALALVQLVEALQQRLDLAGMERRRIVDRLLQLAGGRGLALLKAGKAFGDRGERGVDGGGGFVGPRFRLRSLRLQRRDRTLERLKDAARTVLFGGRQRGLAFKRGEAFGDLAKAGGKIAGGLVGARLGRGGLTAQMRDLRLDAGHQFARAAIVLADQAVAFVKTIETARQGGEG